MKPFKVLTTKEQAILYPHLLRRAHNTSRKQIAVKYRDNLEEVERCKKRSTDLRIRIGEIEDRVANRADKTYGGWGWRRDKKKLKKVVDQMTEAGNAHRVRLRELDDRIQRLMRPYEAELSALQELHDKLIHESELYL